MALSDKLIRVADKLLNRFDVTDRAIYKRVYTRTGGDALLGRPGTVSYVDTIMNPQPIFGELSFHRGNTPRNSVGLIDSGIALIGDYLLQCSPTSVTVTELANKEMTFIAKDSNGNEEQFFIVTYKASAVNGVDVFFTVLLRSKSR